MNKQLFRAIVILIILLTTGITGCSGAIINKANPPATITATILPATITAKRIEQIDIAENKWKSMAIPNYHIVIKFYEAFVAGLETQRDVTVRNHKVVNSFCVSNKCPAFVFTDVYTVDDLFAVARGSTLPDSGGSSESYSRNSLGECLQTISFNPSYSFPKYISIDCPEWDDEDNSVEVISFEVLQ